MTRQFRIVASINYTICEVVGRWYNMADTSIHTLDSFIKWLSKDCYNIRIEFREV